MLSQSNFSRTAVIRRLLIVAIFAMPVAAASVASAATVTWSAPQTITSNNNIQNPADVVAAINYGGVNTSVTVGVNTVNFVGSGAPFNDTFSDETVFDQTGNSVDNDFDSVLDSFGYTWPGNGGSSETQSFTGLNAGGTYLLQAFISDDRDGVLGWTVQLTIDGVSQTITTLPAGTSQFANATIQLGPSQTSFDLDMLGIGNLGLVQLNAVVLSEAQAAVPEPSTFVLAALGLAGLGLLAWRRKK